MVFATGELFLTLGFFYLLQYNIFLSLALSPAVCFFHTKTELKHDLQQTISNSTRKNEKRNLYHNINVMDGMTECCISKMCLNEKATEKLYTNCRWSFWRVAALLNDF